jgi:prepilin-type N-terminal cleavage/methylation domain-containing protein
MLMMTPTKPMQGFTLVEIIVSVGLFSVVMLVSTAAYLTIITLDKEARATNELVVNLSFAVDSISRNIRTGKDYSCAGVGNGTCSQFSFTDSQGQTVTYLMKGATVAQCVFPAGDTTACSSSLAVSLTDPRITINTLVFNVRGVGVSDPREPQTVMSIRGTMPSARGRAVQFTLQTSATQRYLEI